MSIKKKTVLIKSSSSQKALSLSQSATEKIIAICTSEFTNNNEDCNKFLKSVAKHFFSQDAFKSLNANQIIDLISVFKH